MLCHPKSKGRKTSPTDQSSIESVALTAKFDAADVGPAGETVVKLRSERCQVLVRLLAINTTLLLAYLAMS